MNAGPLISPCRAGKVMVCFKVQQRAASSSSKQPSLPGRLGRRHSLPVLTFSECCSYLLNCPFLHWASFSSAPPALSTAPPTGQFGCMSETDLLACLWRQGARYHKTAHSGQLQSSSLCTAEICLPETFPWSLGESASATLSKPAASVSRPPSELDCFPFQ